MIPISPTHVVSGLLDHIQTIVSFINDVKNANEDQKKLFNEVKATQDLIETQDLLKSLESHATQDSWKATLEKLNEPGGLFHELGSELEKMRTKLDPKKSKFSKAKKALTWHFTKSEFKKHFDRIERIKALLHLAQQNDLTLVPFHGIELNCRRLIDAINAKIDSMHEMMKGRHYLVIHLILDERNSPQNNERREIITCLSKLNYWQTQDEIFRRHQAGTCEWFLNDVAFQNWIHGDTSTVLWCPGDRTLLSLTC
jgi:hypothetical protein